MSLKEMSSVWGMNPNGVLHVGAHLGEEANDYESYGWLPVIWVEAQPDLVKSLRSKLHADRHQVFEAAVWDENDVKMTFLKANNSQSSSLLNFGSHSKSYPAIKMNEEFEVSTVRLDTLLGKNVIPNFANFDIQGAEGRAIISLGGRIDSIDAIYTEVNRKEVYLGCMQIDDMDNLLKSKGFERVAVRWVLGKGWGDALYLRKGVYTVSLGNRARKFGYILKFYRLQLFNQFIVSGKLLLQRIIFKKETVMNEISKQ
jgi:FkbM family methyltransferase